MIDFGLTLRKAREAKGLTTKDISDKTHLMTSQVEALENEDFSKIAAPIYGRGFVKLYCQTVGLDPKPLIDEFMDIFTNNREPSIRMREARDNRATPVSAPARAQEPPPAPAFEPQLSPAFEPPAEPAFEASPAAEPAPATASAPEPPAPGDFSLEGEAVPPVPAPRRISRYAAPLPLDERMDDDEEDDGFPLPRIPKSFWRIAILATVAITIIYFIIVSVNALYDASMATNDQPQGEETPANTTQQPKQDKTPTIPERPRSVKTIAPLYVD